MPRKTARSTWYWHRLRAMDLGEIARRLERASRRAIRPPSAGRLAALRLDAEPRPFPRLPVREHAPESYRRAVAAGNTGATEGRWRAFDGLDLALDDPPRWQRDYLAGVDLDTAEPATRLDPRRPPMGADARVIWELSRWHPVMLLARAAWLLERRDAAELCLSWLEDWTANNPPFTGWNWTSALESGVRLTLLAWIDALLRPVVVDDASSRLDRVLRALAPAHVWFTWRERSFGSSANNHLLAELAGLLAAAARWPALVAAGAAPIEKISAAFEREVLAQFAPDGGNREQALRYHLFALELAAVAVRAMESAGRPVDAAVADRLRRAAEFYATVQVEREPWDYGDSDDAAALRFIAAGHDPRPEWLSWLRGEPGGEAIRFWLGAGRGVDASASGAERPATAPVACRVFPDSGIAICRAGGWTARLDGSPLGYLSTAAHGHLDALHLSLWLDGAAIVIDPGTGTYYADARLRELLASRRSHNGPCPVGLDRPRRLGPFLWSEHHATPTLAAGADGSIAASAPTAIGAMHRVVRHVAAERAWTVADRAESGADFWVRWQLAPGSTVERVGERAFRVTRGESRVLVAATGPWAEVATGAGPVSPSFRVVVEAPFLAWRAGAAAASFELTTRFGPTA